MFFLSINYYFQVCFDLKVILQELSSKFSDLAPLNTDNEMKYNSEGLGPLYLKISLDHVDSLISLYCVDISGVGGTCIFFFHLIGLEQMGPRGTY